MDKVVLVAKGISLLSNNNLCSKLNTFETIIRINHLPNIDNKHIIGERTNIFCCRSLNKYSNFKPMLTKDIDVWHAHPKSIVLDETYSVLNQLKCKSLTFLEEMDLQLIKTHFDKSYFTFEYIKSETDIKMNYSFPDTGFTGIVMCLNRFKNSKIYVCGFDNYKNKNKNIYETKSDVSIFKTPVFAQELFYRYLINKQLIHELK